MPNLSTDVENADRQCRELMFPIFPVHVLRGKDLNSFTDTLTKTKPGKKSFV